MGTLTGRARGFEWFQVGNLSLPIVAGVGLAGRPVAAFNIWLNGLVERQGQEELDLTALRSLSLAEARIERSVATLDVLASRGVDSCRAGHVEALRQATFATTPV